MQVTVAVRAADGATKQLTLTVPIQAPASPVKYGASTHGWFAAVPGTTFQTEDPDVGAQRAIAAYGGAPDLLRYYGTTPPNYFPPTVVPVIEAMPTATLVKAMLARFTGDVVFTYEHEPENDQGTVTDAWIAQWGQDQINAANIVHAADPTRRAKYCACLMGSTYMVDPVHPRLNRYTDAATGNQPWDQWITPQVAAAIDLLGADSYQHGKGTSGTPYDTPQEILGPPIAAARLRGKKILFCEFGIRRVDKSGLQYGIPDSQRAQFANDAIALFDANSDIVYGVMYFESSNGNSDMVPWNNVAPPNYVGSWSPLTLAAWKAACSR